MSRTDKILFNKVKLTEENRVQPIKSSGSSSDEKSEIKEMNRIDKVYDFSYTASVTFRGRFDLLVGETIMLNIYCKDGTLHFASGKYFISERTDSISADFTTTLKLIKLISGEEPGKSLNLESNYSGSNTYGSSDNTGYNSTFISTGPESGTITEGTFVPTITGTEEGKAILTEAAKYVGYPYEYGGSSLTEGCDCSHFIYLVLKNCGYDVEYKVSDEWRNYGEPVDRDKIQPGDILCYSGHVAFYMGGGYIIHALNKNKGITVSNTDPLMFLGGLIEARRAVK